MDQLLAMRAFVRVVESGSFTRAADSLDMPNATMSKLVRELEAHLGALLLQRTTRRISVTPEGQSYYAKATRILSELDDIDGSFSRARSAPRGRLRIDVGGITARDVLIPLLPEFMSQYPDIRIELGVSDRAVDLIEDNVDCVVRGGSMDDSSLVARSLGHATMVTCATPAYLKRHGVPAYPEELRNGHKLIGYVLTRNGRSVPLRFRRDAEKIEMKLEHYIGVNESNAHLAACMAGLGIAQTFLHAVKPAIHGRVLVEVLRKWRPAPYPFHLVYPQSRHVTQRLKVFMDWLVQRFPAVVSGD